MSAGILTIALIVVALAAFSMMPTAENVVVMMHSQNESDHN